VVHACHTPSWNRRYGRNNCPVMCDSLAMCDAGVKCLHEEINFVPLRYVLASYESPSSLTLTHALAARACDASISLIVRGIPFLRRFCSTSPSISPLV
jgi:hypothetical protein